MDSLLHPPRAANSFLVFCLIPWIGLSSSGYAQDAQEDAWTTRQVLTLPEAMPPILDFAIHANLQDVFFLVGDPNRQQIFINGVFVNPPDLSFFAPLRNGSHSFSWSTARNVDGRLSEGKGFLNGELLVEDDWVGVPQVSSDGQVMAYWKGNSVVYTKNGGYEAGHYTLMQGDKVVAEQERRPSFTFALSPDGKKMAYVLEPERLQKTLYLGKKELGKGQFISHLHWSSNSSKIAFQAGTGGLDRSQVYLHGKPAKHEFESASTPALDPKGKKLAFLFRDEDKLGVMVGKKAWKERWDLLSPPVWSPNGKSVAVIANLGADPILLRSNSFGSGWFASPFLFHVDRDTGGFRLAEKQGTFQLVVDGEPQGQTYLLASNPVWGPKSKQLAFRAESEDGWRIVVGESESEVYERVTAPLFHPSGRLVGFGALRGKEVHWVVLETAASK